MRRLKQQYLCVGAVLLTGTLVACGGAAPQPEPAPKESAPAVEPPLAEEAEVEPESEPVEAVQGSSEPASPADLQEALQVVLSDDALQKALNLTEPGRFPVKVAGPNFPSDLKLEVGAKPVELVSPPEDPKSAVLVFTDVELNASHGSFRYRYEIDGVRGTSHVVKTGERWELKSSRLSGY